MKKSTLCVGLLLFAALLFIVMRSSGFTPTPATETTSAPTTAAPDVSTKFNEFVVALRESIIPA